MAEDRVKLLLALDDQMSGGLSRVAGAMGKIQGPVDRARSSFAGVGGTIVVVNQALELASKAWRALDGSIGQIVRTTDKFKRLELQLTNLLGSSDKATESMGFLVELAKKTPQTLETLTDGFVKLTAGGVENAERGMIALTNAVSAFGGSDEALKRATVAIQQMAGKGVISMEELRQQLGESIPTAMKVMARELGVDMKTLVDTISRGALDANTGIQALFQGLEKDFAGAAQSMMDTWAGATSNLQDSWDQLLKAIGETGIWEKAIEVVQGLTVWINKLTDAIKRATGEIGFGLNLEQLNFELAKTTALLESAKKSQDSWIGRFVNYSATIKTHEERIKGLNLAITNLQAKTIEVVSSFNENRQATNDVKKATDELTIKIKSALDATDEYGFALQGAISWEEAFERAQVETRSAVEATTEAIKAATKVVKEYGIGLEGVSKAADEAARRQRELGDSAFDSAANLQGAAGFVGERVGSQFAGFQGAMAGSQAGGPVGAAAGFALDLILSNETMREAIAQVNEVLALLIAPIAEAIAPSLKALVPILTRLQPVFELIGKSLELQLAPLIAVLEWLAPTMDSLNKWALELEGKINRTWENIKTFFIDLGNVIVAPINALATALEPLEDIPGDIAEAIEDVFRSGGAIVDSIVTAFKDGVDSIFSPVALESMRAKIFEAVTGGMNAIFLQTSAAMAELFRVIFRAVKEAFTPSGVGNLFDILPGAEQLPTPSLPENPLALQTAGGGGNRSLVININGSADASTVERMVQAIEEQMALGRLAL